MQTDRSQLVVGFDLDMTLIDPRNSVRSALRAVAEETGTAIDVEHIVQHLGPPLETMLAPWFEAEALDAACWRYRDLHGLLLGDLTEAMPGAAEAVRSVHRLGGRTVVVTAKYEPHARASLEAVGIAVDEVVGWRFGPAKADAIIEHGAELYVGDHPADVLGAHLGGAFAVAVATGAATASELEGVGADVVLEDLVAFPDWLEHWFETRTDPEPRP